MFSKVMTLLSIRRSSFSDEDKEPRFDVWWAASGKVGEEPKVKYWLKDHHWGLVYDFKKKLGELK